MEAFRSFGSDWARRAGVLTLLLSTVLWTACAGPPPAEETAAQPAAAAVVEPSLEYPKWETVSPGENASYNQRASLVQRGAEVYDKYCVGCHGEYGDGSGAASERLITRPRDFRNGIYKFRSTDSSSLPMEADLYRTITRGLARVSMPAFPHMPENEKIAVIEYIKGFYPGWDQRSGQRQVVSIPNPPSDLASEERIARGRVVYLVTQCWLCHGVDGRGKGATQTEYTDAWGYPQKAFDFTRGSLKGGGSPEDIYRTFHTGLRSIMPSFGGDTLGRVTADGVARLSGSGLLELAEIEQLIRLSVEYPADGLEVANMTAAERAELAERNSWDMVAYILSLRTETTTAAAVLGAAGG